MFREGWFDVSVLVLVLGLGLDEKLGLGEILNLESSGKTN